MQLFPSVAEGVPVAVVNVVAAQPAHDDLTPSEAPKSRGSADAAAALKQHDHMWSNSLSSILTRSVAAHPLRIVVLDNSGSMRASDGNRLIQDRYTYKSLRCTRWDELLEDAASIAKMSDALQCRTDFHLLNPSCGFDKASVCSSSWDGGIRPLGHKLDANELQSQLRRVIPTGGTPLTEAVMRIVKMIQPAAPRLRASGQAVTVLLCTDGLPNDKRSFVHAMHLLQQLPVWCIVRLVTDDNAVVSYWNDLDNELEAPLEVLDDVRSEAVEVAQRNPWVTYTPPLHLARLFGLPDKLFDALDEAPLIPSQIKVFLEMILGCDRLPEPDLDMSAFLEDVRLALMDQPPAYDPRSGKLKPIVDLPALERALKRNGRCNNESVCAIM